jgi:preprotein translocase subunit YajC
MRADRKAGIVPLAAASSGGNSLGVWIPLLLLLAVAYFLLVRPQQRRRREIQALQSAMGPGDEVVTVAGLYGTIVDIDDKVVTIEVSPGITNRYARQAIGQVVKSASQPDEPERPEATTPETTAKDVVDPD